MGPEERIIEYKDLIDTVPLFREKLSDEDKGTLAGALEESFFMKDEEVVKQGDDGDTFYIVFEGVCQIFINGVLKGDLSKGKFFGERALLTKEPRAATVVCASDTATLLSLDSQSFSLLIGDHMEEMQEELYSSETSKPSHTPRSSHHHLCLEDKLAVGRRRSALSSKIPLDSLEPIGALGYGSFGSVTLRRDKRTQKLYALKALSKGYIKEKKLVEHVVSEKKTLELLDSEFVVLSHASYRDAQYVYFLLEPALGGELFELYDQNPRIFGSDTHARFYTVCAAIGLDHLHSKKIVYRDLKLENCLLGGDGYAIITDLGLAKVVIGRTFTVCGTADYFAPETLRQTGHNRAVDWWALGIMLFIMMAGRSPFDADDIMQIYKNIVKGFKHYTFPPEFSPELTNLVKAMCRKIPEERLPMGPGGMQNLEEHEWFEDIPFEKYEKHMVTPPFQPGPPDFGKYAQKLEAGVPPEVEFVENDPRTDDGWDDCFD